MVLDDWSCFYWEIILWGWESWWILCIFIGLLCGTAVNVVIVIRLLIWKWRWAFAVLLCQEGCVFEHCILVFILIIGCWVVYYFQETCFWFSKCSELVKFSRQLSCDRLWNQVGKPHHFSVCLIQSQHQAQFSIFRFALRDLLKFQISAHSFKYVNLSSRNFKLIVTTISF